MSDLSEEDRRILRHLRERSASGDRYFRAHQIADAVGLSAKQVGVRLGRLREAADDLVIEPWGRSRSTTWRVRPSP